MWQSIFNHRKVHVPTCAACVCPLAALSQMCGGRKFQMFAKSRVALLLTLFYLGHSKRATESRSDVELQSNASAGTGRCDRNKNIPQQITVLRYGVQPGQAISRTCFEGCSASEMSGKHFSEEFVKAAAGFANPDGVAKALIYGGLHAATMRRVRMC
ncbi:unnamed protein product [Effrenium voratum]|nr:unnamed protein product [Effrenium voratum]